MAQPVAPVIRFNRDLTELSIVKDGVGSSGRPFQSKVTQTSAGSFTIDALDGEMEIFIATTTTGPGSSESVLIALVEVGNPIVSESITTRDVEGFVNRTLKKWCEG